MNKNRGFTLIELMIVIVVVAIGITLAVPSFTALIERKAVGGAAEAAYEQLQRARSQAVKRSKPILVDFYAPVGTDWAIGFTDKPAGCNAEDASGANACTVEYDNDPTIDYGSDGVSDIILMRIQGVNHKNITMSPITAFADYEGILSGNCTLAPAGTACFDYVRGFASQGKYDFESTNYKLQVQVDLLGHVKICIPTDEKKIVGYDVCT